MWKSTFHTEFLAENWIKWVYLYYRTHHVHAKQCMKNKTSIKFMLRCLSRVYVVSVKLKVDEETASFYPGCRCNHGKLCLVWIKRKMKKHNLSRYVITISVFLPCRTWTQQRTKWFCRRGQVLEWDRPCWPFRGLQERVAPAHTRRDCRSLRQQLIAH